VSGALRLRPRLIDVERTPTNVGTVQGSYGFLGLAFRHLNKSKTSRAAGVSVRHYVDALHGSVRREERAEGLVGRAEIQVPYENLLQGESPSV
jgi:hypothetical protein